MLRHDTIQAVTGRRPTPPGAHPVEVDAQPGLCADSHVLTPGGPVRAADLLAGDVVLTRAGHAVLRATTQVVTPQGLRHRLHCDLPEVLQLDGAEALSAPLPGPGARRGLLH